MSNAVHLSSRMLWQNNIQWQTLQRVCSYPNWQTWDVPESNIQYTKHSSLFCQEMSDKQIKSFIWLAQRREICHNLFNDLQFEIKTEKWNPQPGNRLIPLYCLRNLLTGPISSAVSPLQAFLASFNVCNKAQKPTLEGTWKSLVLHANSRLGWKCLTRTNTLAYWTNL